MRVALGQEERVRERAKLASAAAVTYTLREGFEPIAQF